MKLVKRVLLTVLGILLVGGATSIFLLTSKTNYYTQIVSEGEKVISHSQNGKETFVEYRYVQDGYNKKGEAKELDFNSHPSLGRPFKKDAYMKVGVNRWKGELSYEEVQRDEIPQKALDQLTKE